MKTKFLFVLFVSALGFFLFSALSNNRVAAATCVWSGNSSVNMNDSGNWAGCTGGGVPQNGDILTFPATVNSQDLTNDIVGLQVDQVNINDTYSFTGNAITITNNSSIIVNGTGVVFNLPINANTNFGIQSSQEVYFTGEVDLSNFNLILDTLTGGTIRFTGEITGNGNITTYGQGEVMFEVANSMVGNLNINEGSKLALGNSSSLGNISNIVTLNDDSRLRLLNTIQIPQDIIMNDNSIILNSNGDNQLTGQITLGTNTSFDIGLGTLETFGVLTGGSFRKYGPNTLTFSGANANTFTGSCTVEDGTLVLSKTSGNFALSSSCNVGDGSGPDGSASLVAISDDEIVHTATIALFSDGYFDMTGTTQTFNTLHVTTGYAELAGSTANITNVNIYGGTVNGGDLNIGDTINIGDDGTNIGNLSSTVNFATDINFNVRDFGISGDLNAYFNGILVGSHQVNRGGDPGTLVTLGSDSPGFLGNLILLTGSTKLIANYGNSTVSTNGGTLIGHGGIVGHILGYTGQIVVGDTTSDFFAGIYDIASPMNLHFDLNGTNQGVDYDFMSVSGIANISGNLIINANFFPTNGTSFTIFHATGGVNGTFNGIPDEAFIASNGGGIFKVQYTSTDVIITAVGPFTLFNNTFYTTPTNPVINQPFTVTSIWSTDLGGPTPTGTAELFDGSTSLGTVSLVNGVATFNVTGLPAGVHSLTVNYYGDSIFGGATSLPLVLGSLAETGIRLPINLMTLTLLFTLTGIIIYKKYEN